jgi:sulfur-carrier protein
MRITVYATLRGVIGSRTLDITVREPVTVREMIDVLVTSYPALRPHLLNERSELLPYVHVFVDGRDAPYLEDGVATLVRADAAVDIFPAVAGGRGTM